MDAHALPGMYDLMLRRDFCNINDPAASGTMLIEKKGFAKCEVITATAETRVLDSADNYGVGQILMVILATAGGALTITGSDDGSVVLSNAKETAIFEVVTSVSGSTRTNVWKTVTVLNARGSAMARGLNYVTITENTAGTGTASVADLRAGVYELSTGSTATITLPTGAVMWAGIGGAKVGDSFDCLVNNNNSGTTTFAAGASGSLGEGAVLTVATAACRLIRFVLTSADNYTAFFVV